MTLWFVEVEKNEMKRSFAQRVGNFCLLSEDIKLRAKQTAPLVNKHYQNEVILTGPRPPLKCCQPLKIQTHFITGLDLSMVEILGL